MSLVYTELEVMIIIKPPRLLRLQVRGLFAVGQIIPIGTQLLHSLFCNIELNDV